MKKVFIIIVNINKIKRLMKRLKCTINSISFLKKENENGNTES